MDNFLQISLYGGIIILFVMLIRLFLINKLPKRLLCVFWFVCIIRLCLPLNISSPLSIYNVALPASVSTPVTITEQLDEAPTTYESAPKEMPAVSEATPKNYISPYLVVWLSGAFVLGCYFIFNHLRYKTDYKTSLPASKEIYECLKEIKTYRKINIRICDKIFTPLTYGIFKPVILLPKFFDTSNTEELKHVIAHEVTHINNLDVLIKIALATVLCIHWFNPLVWVMYILASKDIELACDEKVVRLTGNKQEYALTLIKLEEKRSFPLHICNNFSQNAIAERIKMIMKTKKISIIAVITAVMILACVTTAFATSKTPPYNPNIREGEIQTNVLEGDIKKAMHDMKYYAEYVENGIYYDESTDLYYYQGKILGYLIDTTHGYGTSCYYYDSGEIGLKIIRDSNNKLVRFAEIPIPKTISNTNEILPGVAYESSDGLVQDYALSQVDKYTDEDTVVNAVEATPAHAYATSEEETSVVHAADEVAVSEDYAVESKANETTVATVDEKNAILQNGTASEDAIFGKILSSNTDVSGSYDTNTFDVYEPLGITFDSDTGKVYYKNKIVQMISDSPYLTYLDMSKDAVKNDLNIKIVRENNKPSSVEVITQKEAQAILHEMQ